MEVNQTRIKVWGRFLRVSQNLLSTVETELKSADLPSLSWYDVLLELKRSDPERLRPFELQERMVIEQYNLSRLIDKMVAAGYVDRHAIKEDGRGHSLKITTRGLQMQKRMWPIYHQAIQDHFSVMLEDLDIQSLDDILIKIQNKRS